jgi:hypothetical protein
MADSGTVRVIDVLILTKDADGTRTCPGVTNGAYLASSGLIRLS